jgi:hypothetical protein
MTKVLVHTKRGTQDRRVDPMWEQGGLAVIEQTWVEEEDTWSITHASSGYAIVTDLPMFDVAEDLMRELLTLGSWERSSSELAADKDLARKTTIAKKGSLARWHAWLDNGGRWRRFDESA